MNLRADLYRYRPCEIGSLAYYPTLWIRLETDTPVVT